MLTTESAMWRRYKKLEENPDWSCVCPVCQEKIDYGDQGVEYVKTKRGTELFIHSCCVPNWGKVGGEDAL